MPVKKPKVRIRMYRHGLGDCFLLTFTEGNQTINMMIDCGVIVGTANPSAIMTKVVEDIEKETGGKLDVVAVTHEHWDHISGFSQAKEVFDRIDFGEVWVGWTEEPGNKVADELRQLKKKKVDAIDNAVTKLAEMNAERWDKFAVAVRSLLEFEEGALGAAANNSTSGAWSYVLGKSPGKPRCFRPGGKTFEIPGLKGFRVYILGPPESVEDIKKLSTSKSEFYHNFAPLSYDTGFYAAVSMEEDFNQFAEAARPFDGDRRMLWPDAQAQFAANYYDPLQDWRTIDEDWLAVSGELALNINSYTNNTCLAFAIEFIEPGAVGKVMIFPGDAQFGNWNSWKTLEWDVKDKDGTKRKVTAAELLERTVFYKVGHHGSHNATPSKQGLELMNSPELVAMIPVNREMAEKKEWKMPFDPLFTRLKEKARGRVILADDPDKVKIKKDSKDLLSAAEWKKFDKAMDNTSDIFVDYTVE